MDWSPGAPGEFPVGWSISGSVGRLLYIFSTTNKKVGRRLSDTGQPPLSPRPFGLFLTNVYANVYATLSNPCLAHTDTDSDSTETSYNRKWKSKGRAEKLRDKGVKSLHSNASKCKKLNDLFGSSSTSATDANIEVLNQWK